MLSLITQVRTIATAVMLCIAVRSGGSGESLEPVLLDARRVDCWQYDFRVFSACKARAALQPLSSKCFDLAIFTTSIDRKSLKLVNDEVAE